MVASRWSLASATLALGILAVSVASSSAAASPDPPSHGGADALVTIIELTDFECPFCARVQPTLSALVDRYGDQIAFEILHVPLGFHRRAEPAARAAVAAGAQGKLWEMRAILFERQHALEDADLMTYARVLGLDIVRFGVDSSSEATRERVARERAIAAALGARGTPHFFINGKSLRGAQPLHAFAEIIDAELAVARASDGPAGRSWSRERTRAENPDLYRFVYLGEPPPDRGASSSIEAPPRADDTVWRVTVAADDATQGPADALVTLVVFSNFQCPFCARLARTVDELRERYGADLRVVFKHHPLSFHKRAMSAAVAAVCAGQQQRFWPFHDLLLHSQRALEDDDLRRYAEQVGLDPGRFGKCVKAPATRARVAEDMALAARVGARGTPVSFINGKRVPGARPLAELAALIDAELAAARAMRAARGVDVARYDAIIAGGEEVSPLDSEARVFDLAKRPQIGRAARDAIPIVVFTDYACPDSQRIWRTFMAEVERTLGRAVTLHVKHFPLTDHPAAGLMAQAVMCAHEQGRFRALHDRLIAARPEAVEPGDDVAEEGPHAEDADPDARRAAAALEIVRADARAARLNLSRFDTCIRAERYAALVAADQEEARAAGVRRTPAVYVAGHRFSPAAAYSLEELATVIEALAAAKKGAR